MFFFVTRASSKVTLSYSPIVLFTLNSICCGSFFWKTHPL